MRLGDEMRYAFVFGTVEDASPYGGKQNSVGTGVLDGPFFDFLSIRKRAAKFAARGFFIVRCGTNTPKHMYIANTLLR